MVGNLKTDQEVSAFKNVQRKNPARSKKTDSLNKSSFTELNPEKLARGLGWFSVGLGLTELVSPNVVAKVSGLGKTRPTLIRLYGLRELAAGIGILKSKKPEGAVWSRVAGDALDLASLGVAFNSPNSKRGRLAFTTANILAITALDILCAKQLSKTSQSTRTSHSEGINEPRSNQAEASQILREMRDDIFESNDERLALALGKSTDHIQRMIAGTELVDGDLLMKARALREERS